MHLIIISILLCSLGYSKIFHGVGMQMTSTGTGVYYKPGIPINNNSQLMANIGLHFDDTMQTPNYYVFNNISISNIIYNIL